MTWGKLAKQTKDNIWHIRVLANGQQAAALGNDLQHTLSTSLLLEEAWTLNKLFWTFVDKPAREN